MAHDVWTDPWSLAAQGLVPGYSGLFQNPETTDWAWTFSILEIVTLANAVYWSQGPGPALQDENLPWLVFLSMKIAPPGQPPVPLDRLGPVNLEALAGMYLWLSSQNQVKGPNGSFMDAGQLQRNRNNSYALLATVLISDAVLSWLWGAPATTARRAGDSRWALTVQPEFEEGVFLATQHAPGPEWLSRAAWQSYF